MSICIQVPLCIQLSSSEDTGICLEGRMFQGGSYICQVVFGKCSASCSHYVFFPGFRYNRALVECKRSSEGLSTYWGGLSGTCSVALFRKCLCKGFALLQWHCGVLPIAALSPQIAVGFSGHIGFPQVVFLHSSCSPFLFVH